MLIAEMITSDGYGLARDPSVVVPLRPTRYVGTTAR